MEKYGRASHWFNGERIRYDFKGLNMRAIIIGMTGSGKSGLGIVRAVWSQCPKF